PFRQQQAKRVGHPADAHHRVAPLRHREWQPQVRQLHGAQRIRSLGGQRHLRLAVRILGHRARTFSTTYKDDEALAMLTEPTRPVHAYGPMVQIAEPTLSSKTGD